MISTSVQQEYVLNIYGLRQNNGRRNDPVPIPNFFNILLAIISFLALETLSNEVKM